MKNKNRLREQVVIAALLILTACAEQKAPDNNAAGSAAGSSQDVAAAAPATTPDGRSYASAQTMFEKFKNGVLYCYAPGVGDSCESVQYAETVVGPTQVNTMAIYKWNDVEKQVMRHQQKLKGDAICVTTDEWSVERANYYTSFDNVAKIQSTDISAEPDGLERWRKDLRERWSGIMGHEFCYRYALRRDEKGETHGGEFEEFKFSGGVLQPTEEPVYLNTYEHKDLGNLTLRPQN
ncbi:MULTISPECIES: hypothetical protein [Sphingobium]|uniref:hypothetical protein n=1 Tax=Sphingobium TaxID=165695 RepID=UPI0015EB4354|nr:MULTISPECIES: hypothetical protein [Sphingobium]MCW2361637.1 hypothetical protein [Sphingobium sp. B10D3B]MCW2401684.1 hypothetical protein [Sphingobium sp. B10D7B]MCW2408664.1 hypothetical protein [Sphingobium xanthum]